MPDGIHHVFARGNRRQTIFADDDDRLCYLRLLGHSVEERRWTCLAYCLMTNHVHLLVRTTWPNLGTGIGILHGRYARRFNLRHDVTSHLFHRPFGSKLAPNGATVMYLATYIALNPVRAGLAARPESYVWSSHAAALGLARGPAWLNHDELISYFGDAKEGRRHYEAVVDAVRLLGAAGFDPVTAERRA